MYNVVLVFFSSLLSVSIISSKRLVLIMFVTGFFAQMSYSTDVEIFKYKGQKLHMEGTWLFYWKELVNSDNLDITHAKKVNLPAYWRDMKDKNKNLPPTGYASYVAIIESDSTYDIGVKYFVPHTAQKIFLNEKVIVETGSVAKYKSKHRADWLPGTALATLKKGRNVLIIQLSNYEHVRGGVFKVPVIGNRNELVSARERELLISAIIVGGLLLIGLFFIAIHIFLKRDLAFLYFGLFALIFSIWFSNYGLHIFRVYFGYSDFLLKLRLIYLSLATSFLFFKLFIYHSYKSFFSTRYMVVSYGVFGVFMFSSAFLSPLFFTSLLPYFQFFGMVTFVYCCFGIMKAVKAGLKNAKVMLAGLILFCLTMAITLGDYQNLILGTESLNSILFFTTFIVFSIALAEKMARAFKEVITLKDLMAEQSEKIQAQADEISHSMKLKTQWFTNIAHELKTPLTLISGPVKHLLSHGEFVENVSKELKLINRNTEHLANLVTEILDLSKLEEGVLKTNDYVVNISRIIDYGLSSYDSLACVNEINLKKEKFEKVLVKVDPEKFLKVILNLLSNALKYTPRGGEVSVSCFQYESNCVIKVKDNGEGIDEKDLPYIFDRFYQTTNLNKNVDGGAGIGLYLTKQIIEMYNGTIVVSSKQGEGALFTIVLPNNNFDAVGEQQVQEKGVDLITVTYPTPKKYEPRLKEKPSLLLVEDNVDMREYIQNILKHNYDIQEARDGKEALEKLNTLNPDIIISDVMMPRMNGNDFAKHIRSEKKWAGTPLIMLSALTSPDDRLYTLRIGVDDYLGKPFNPDELKVRIQNLLQNRIQRQEEDVSSYEDELLKMLEVEVKLNMKEQFLNVSYLADKVAISERHLHRCVKGVTGLTPGQFIQEIKLLKALELLEKRMYATVSEVAYEVGYKRVSHFTSVFEKRFGKKPSVYLRKNVLE